MRKSLPPTALNCNFPTTLQEISIELEALTYILIVRKYTISKK